MKIAIFNHPFTDFYCSIQRIQPGTLYYLQHILKDHETIVFDVVGNLKKQIQTPLKLQYLNEYLINDISGYSFFKNYYKFGDEKNFDHNKFLNFSPEVAIISSFAYCYFEGYKLMVNFLRKLYQNLIIICGGSGPSSFPYYYITNSDTDYAIKGPAEITLKGLLDQIFIKKEITTENIYLKNKNSVTKININYKFKPFFYISGDRAILQVTRGCPKKCTYCSIHCANGAKYLKAQLNDISLLFKNIPKIKHIYFEDDNISFDKKYFINLIKLLNKHCPQVSFSMENGIDFTTLDRELIKKIIKSGISQWNISLTSANSAVLKTANRNYNIKNFNNILNILINYKQKIIVYFICGLPGDKEENILKTILFLAKKNVLIGISMFYPVPGTEIIKNLNKALSPEISKGSSFFQWSNISTKKLVTFFMIVRFINTFKNIQETDLLQYAKNTEYDKFIENYNNNPQNSSFLLEHKSHINILGIQISLKNKKITGIIKNKKGFYEFKEYNLDIELQKKFFDKFINSFGDRAIAFFK